VNQMLECLMVLRDGNNCQMITEGPLMHDKCKVVVGCRLLSISTCVQSQGYLFCCTAYINFSSSTCYASEGDYVWLWS